MSLGLMPDRFPSFICDDALDKPGYVLVVKSNGHVGKADADSPWAGVALTSTKDPITGTAKTGVPVAVVTSGIVTCIAGGDIAVGLSLIHI